MAVLGNEIKQFYALEGRYPSTLTELEEWRGQPLPTPPPGYAYEYDSTTGKFSAVRVR